MRAWASGVISWQLSQNFVILPCHVHLLSLNYLRPPLKTVPVVCLCVTQIKLRETHLVFTSCFIIAIASNWIGFSEQIWCGLLGNEWGVMLSPLWQLEQKLFNPGAWYSWNTSERPNHHKAFKPRMNYDYSTAYIQIFKAFNNNIHCSYTACYTHREQGL